MRFRKCRYRTRSGSDGVPAPNCVCYRIRGSSESVGTEPGAVATGSRHPTAFATESEAVAKGFGAKQTVDPTIVTRSVETDVSLLLQTASCSPITSGQSRIYLLEMIKARLMTDSAVRRERK